MALGIVIVDARFGRNMKDFAVSYIGAAIQEPVSLRLARAEYTLYQGRYTRNAEDAKLSAAVEAQNHGVSLKNADLFLSELKNKIYVLSLQLDNDVFRKGGEGVNTPISDEWTKEVARVMTFLQAAEDDNLRNLRQQVRERLKNALGSNPDWVKTLVRAADVVEVAGASSARLKALPAFK